MGRKTAALLLALGGSVILSAQTPGTTRLRRPQRQPPQVACAGDVDSMMAALPDKAPAKPQKPRKVLVLAHAAGFVHSSIPLAAKTMEALGDKTGAWTATTTYDPADINTDNLKQYDADRSSTARPAASSTIQRQGRAPTRGAPRCWSSSAAARGSPASTRRATPITVTSARGPPRARRRSLAGVEQDHRRLLQVPLERSAAHHREDRRSEEPADRDVPRPALRDPRRDLHALNRILLAQQCARADQHRLRQDERRRQGEGDRTRAPITTTRLSWIRREGKGRAVLRGARPRRAHLRHAPDARAPPRRHAVRDRRSEGRRQAEVIVVRRARCEVRGARSVSETLVASSKRSSVLGLPLVDGSHSSAMNGYL